MDQDVEEARGQVRELLTEKGLAARELVVVRRERNFLAESIRELQ